MRKILLSLMLLAGSMALFAQTTKSHKVKKNETIYGISRTYGITEDQLRAANPEMQKPGYVLKKGKTIQIPLVSSTAQGDPNGDIRQRPIRLGIMLPLHNKNGDGDRMVEYYRGILMACDTLRREGISVDIRAWNVAQEANVATILSDPEAATRDVIIGPLYSRQMTQMADFCDRNGVRLFIPFSIDAPQLYFNRNIMQVYQQPQELAETTARRCVEWFGQQNFVIIDCADPESTKGTFTSALRRHLDAAGRKCSITSLKSPDASFAAAFNAKKNNVVVLNSARLADLKSVITRMDALRKERTGLKVSLFGYDEWMQYAPTLGNAFHRYDTYLPAPYFTNAAGPETVKMEQRYRANFHKAMQDRYPRLAITGFDHATFLLRGLHSYGKDFDGAKGRLAITPLQTPLQFERIGNGGLQNRAFMFVHYKTDGSIDTINY